MTYSRFFLWCTPFLLFFSGCFFTSPQSYHDTLLIHATDSGDAMEDFIREYLQFSQEEIHEEEYVASVENLRSTLTETIADVEKMNGYRGNLEMKETLLGFLNSSYQLVSYDIQEFIVLSQEESIEDVEALQKSAEKMQTSLHEVMKYQTLFRTQISSFAQEHSLVSP